MRIALNLEGFVGRHFFHPQGVALVSTVSVAGVANVAPKTQVMAVGRHNYWAFACCPGHHTYRNVLEQGEFVINIPGPELIGQVSQAAAEFAPGADEIEGAGLTAFPSTIVAVPSVAECRVHLECRRQQILDGFGGDSLIIGRVVAAFAEAAFASTDPEILPAYPLLAYVHPDHYATIGRITRFTFPTRYKP